MKPSASHASRLSTALAPLKPPLPAPKPRPHGLHHPRQRGHCDSDTTYLCTGEFPSQLFTVCLHWKFYYSCTYSLPFCFRREHTNRRCTSGPREIEAQNGLSRGGSKRSGRRSGSRSGSKNDGGSSKKQQKLGQGGGGGTSAAAKTKQLGYYYKTTTPEVEPTGREATLVCGEWWALLLI